MARLHKFDFVLGAPQSPEHAVDAIARIAKNPAHAPGVKSIHQEVGHCLGHLSSPAAARHTPLANANARVFPNRRKGALFRSLAAQSALSALAREKGQPIHPDGATASSFDRTPVGNE